jgi:hypothetical protein
MKRQSIPARGETLISYDQAPEAEGSHANARLGVTSADSVRAIARRIALTWPRAKRT